MFRLTLPVQKKMKILSIVRKTETSKGSLGFGLLPLHSQHHKLEVFSSLSENGCLNSQVTHLCQGQHY